MFVSFSVSVNLFLLDVVLLLDSTAFYSFLSVCVCVCVCVFLYLCVYYLKSALCRLDFFYEVFFFYLK